MAYGLSARTVQPDPELLPGLMQDNSTQGGWLAPQLCGIRTVSKDYVRWGKQDSQTLLSKLQDTLRAPGDRYNLIPRAIRTWVTSVIQEDAVRIEVPHEDVVNGVGIYDAYMDASLQILNVLQYAFELRVATLFDPSGFAAANKTGVSGGTWAGASTAIEADIENAVLTVLERSGLEPNYIRIPRKKWGGIKASAEITKLRTGNDPIEYANGVPVRLFGLQILFGTGRNAPPTGTFTPAFLWDNSTLSLNNTCHVGFSPFLMGGQWGAGMQTFLGCFENQLNGTAFESNVRDDPNFEENGIHIVYGNVRRSTPEVINPEACFAITGI